MRCIAEPDGTGFRLIVAIADVAHYVRPGSALDHAAADARQQRLFPRPRRADAARGAVQRLVQPAAEGGPRLPVRRTADRRRQGARPAHRFGRGLMRSAARLTYERCSGADTATISALPIRASLRRVPRPARRARTARGTLDLDLPERRVVLDERRQRAQRRAAAAPRQPPADRGIHGAGQCRRRRGTGAAAPALRCTASTRRLRRKSSHRCASFLHGLGISLPPGDQVHPRDLDRVLRRVAGTPEAPLVNEVMLRSQSQAEYSPDNIGHFGLALPRYAHFTSPIRRYADLLVHRALIRGLRLGDGALAADEAAALPRHRAAHHGDRAPRAAGRARRDRPLPRCIHGGQSWREFRCTNFRCDAIRAFRHSRRKRRERARAGALAAGRLLAARRKGADADRTPDPPRVSPGAGGRGPAGRGQPGHRRPGVPHPAG